jgi:C-terminal processing protease CtpA/Prc
MASTVHHTRDDPGDMFVTLAAFDGSVDLATVFDDLLGGSRRSDHLTLDLRGNPGGALLSATAELED